MQNFVHRGETLTLTAPYAVNSGGGVKVGNIFGVAASTHIQGDSMEAQVEGVFDLAKDASVFAQGDLVYWMTPPRPRPAPSVPTCSSARRSRPN